MYSLHGSEQLQSRSICGFGMSNRSAPRKVASYHSCQLIGVDFFHEASNT